MSSSYDWSSFFKITRRNNGDGIVRLKKSLEGAFQVDHIVGYNWIIVTIHFERQFMKYLQNCLFSCTAWSKGWGINSYRAGGEWFHDPKGCACWIRGPRKRHYRIRNWSWVRIQYNIKARSNTYRYVFCYARIVVFLFPLMILADFSYFDRHFFFF